MINVLGVTAWGTYFSLGKKTDFLDLYFSKDEVDHSKHMVVCLGVVIMFLGTSSVPVAISKKIFPPNESSRLTTDCQVTPGSVWKSCSYDNVEFAAELHVDVGPARTEMGHGKCVAEAWVQRH